MKLKNNNILIGITGSIAAYKAAELIRLLVKEGANLKVIMTPIATNFITQNTIATLSKNTVLIDFFKYDDKSWNNHVELGNWAELFVIAPATANTIAKMACGIADNLLLTTYLSVRCSTMIVPAMDTYMYEHPATQENLKILKQRGHFVLEPDNGPLASGLIGKGRMPEPKTILNFIIDFFKKKELLKNKSFLITTGPTIEFIDPVRVISNLSSGKTGFCLANYLSFFNTKVILISGPVSYKINTPNITHIKVNTTNEMFEECKKYLPNIDIAIFSAAPADFKPSIVFDSKIKKSKLQNVLTLNLEPTIDIISELSKLKKNGQIFIGFALETDNFEENAKEKLKEKNLDALILNKITENFSPLGNDFNQISIITKDCKVFDYPFAHKTEQAKFIIDFIIDNFLI